MERDSPNKIFYVKVPSNGCNVIGRDFEFYANIFMRMSLGGNSF